jgi:hypothetical protein
MRRPYDVVVGGGAPVVDGGPVVVVLFGFVVVLVGGWPLPSQLMPSCGR